jgi:hypothetical protein
MVPSETFVTSRGDEVEIPDGGVTLKDNDDKDEDDSQHSDRKDKSSINMSITDALDKIELLDREIEALENECNNSSAVWSDGRISFEELSTASLMTAKNDHSGANASTSKCVDDQHPTLDFITINMNELPDESSFLGIDNGMRDNQETTRDPAAKKVIGQNKLTPEEEERVAEILRQEDDEIGRYILPTIEEMTRQTELDHLLSELGYVFEDEITGNDKPRGNPVLRELAEQRSIEERTKQIDRALRALLREPLPRVIKFSQHNDEELSLLSSGDTLLSFPINEACIKELVEQVRLSLEDEGLSLADHESVRLLATALLNTEAAKGSICSKP